MVNPVNYPSHKTPDSANQRWNTENHGKGPTQHLHDVAGVMWCQETVPWESPSSNVHESLFLSFPKRGSSLAPIFFCLVSVTSVACHRLSSLAIARGIGVLIIRLSRFGALHGGWRFWVACRGGDPRLSYCRRFVTSFGRILGFGGRIIDSWVFPRA